MKWGGEFFVVYVEWGGKFEEIGIKSLLCERQTAETALRMSS